MSLFHWRRWLQTVAPARRCPRPAAGRGPLRLEALEDRCVPAFLTVTNSSGSAAVPGSLPALVANAAPGDTIQFAPGLEGAVITLASALDINKILTIDATGTPNVSVSGGGLVRVFRIEPGAEVSILGLTIVNGVANAGIFGVGGGIDNLGSLSLSQCTVTRNTASNSGGGIFNSGSLVLSFDTFNNNNADSAGSAGGGIDNTNTGTMNITNCTIASNQATSDGGGIFNTGVARIANCTVANNAVPGKGFLGGEGGGILTNGGGNQLFLLNTIVFNPNSGASNFNDVAGTIAQAQGDLFGSSVTIAGGGDLGGNQQGVDPLLGPLENNGGTQTMALQPGSPAIGAGAATSQIARLSVPATDQRAYLRQTNSVDIGAFQTQTGIVADFAGNGVQQNTPGGWQVLSTFDAQAVAVDGAGDVVAAFAGAGLWRRTPDGTWTQIDTFTPQSFVLDNVGIITAAFPGGGLWVWLLGSWAPIDGFTPSSLAVDGPGDVVAAFDGGGLWRLTLAGVWTPIDGFTPQSIAADGQGNVVAAFAGGGVWLWTPNGVWTPIDGFTPQSVSMDAGGDVFASFAGGGLWRFTLGSWVQIDSFTPQQFAADADGQVVAAFADGTVWRFLLGSGWTELNQAVQTVALGATQF
jgi:hypothetical protein